MINLYEFQKRTQEKICEKFKSENLIVLLGEEGSGKSTIINELCKNQELSSYNIIKFTADKTSTAAEYNCIPQDKRHALLEESYSLQISKGFLKDIATTVTNVVGISFTDMMESLMSLQEINELERLLKVLTHNKSLVHTLYVFDNIEYYDSKSVLLMNNLINYIINNVTNFKMLLVANSGESILEMELPEVEFLEILAPTAPEDFEEFKPIPESIIKCTPIKYLIKFKKSSKDKQINNSIPAFYKNQIEKLSHEFPFIKYILYLLTLFDEPLDFSTIAMLLPEIPEYQLYEAIVVLKSKAIIESTYQGKEENYWLLPFIKKSLTVCIPEYVFQYRYSILSKQMECVETFNYVFKYTMYLKIENYENAYGSAISAYCANARGETRFTGTELGKLNIFLRDSPYLDCFSVLVNCYKLYNQNQYDKCYECVSKFHRDNSIWKNDELQLASYTPEFLMESILLRECCVGRIYEHDQTVICEELGLLDAIIKVSKIFKNTYLWLRLEEKKLLLSSYISQPSHKKQKELINHFYKLCNAYQTQIRASSCKSLKQWTTHYAALLMKVNFIPNVVNKGFILNKGYSIFEKSKEYNGKNYLRAACNYACDLMWRNGFDKAKKF